MVKYDPQKAAGRVDDLLAAASHEHRCPTSEPCLPAPRKLSPRPAPTSRHEMHETVAPRPAHTLPVSNFSGARNRFKLVLWAGGAELSWMGRRRAAEPNGGGPSLHHVVDEKERPDLIRRGRRSDTDDLVSFSGYQFQSEVRGRDDVSVMQSTKAPKHH